MGFLADLGNSLASKFSLGENTSDNSLDSSLGDFASKFDRSAERKYLEEGYLRKNSFNTDSKQFEILMQQPQATVLVKKRMFSSIAENYRPDFMDKDEKLYYKAIKVLFQNKCKLISSLEKLSKIEKITSSVGDIDRQLMSLIFSASSDATASLFGQNISGNTIGSPSDANSEMQSFGKIVDRIRKIYAFNNASSTTDWVTDSTNIFQSQFGQGTGVIEITNFTSLNTSVGTDLNSPGSFSLEIVDPYEAMVITEFDIEKAISDSSNLFNNSSLFKFGQESIEQTVNDLKVRLNSFRNNRGASPISFKINQDAAVGKRVITIFDRLGIELPFNFNPISFSGDIEISPEYLKGGEVAGLDGLDDQTKSFNDINRLSPESELTLFQQIIKAIFNKISLDANSKNSFQQNNKNTNYARRKLRFNFLGKLILQPMDPVHIYLGSKSKYDNKLLGGLKEMFSGLNYLQATGGILADMKKQLDSLFNPQALSVQVEKSVFVGPDFPNWLWNMLRPQFVTEKEGVHVFGGLIGEARRSFSEGKFTVSVSGSDNSEYFSQGKVNEKPGADVWNGSFYDPLTPFKSKFDVVSTNFKDETPELLDENKTILGTTQDKSSPLVKFKLGPNAGRAATSDNYIQDRTADPITKQFTKTFYAPNGLVYKWKEGIGTFVQFGSSFDLNDPGKVGTPSIAVDAFAGQDIMNVISLLITGHPYNFATYWKSVQNIDGFGRDPHSQQDASHSFFASLQNDLEKRNALWGNFIPFKNLVLDEASFAKAKQTIFTIQNKNSEIEKKLNELNDLESKAIGWGLHALNNDNKNGATPAQVKIINEASNFLSFQINVMIGELKAQDTAFTVQTGDDITFDFDEFLYKGNDRAKLANAEERRLLRRQSNFLTRRMSYNVRANEDKNLFIVDDSYDKDYDIAAFNSALDNGIQLYNNQYLAIKDKINASAKLLNLEVFCDTQGHIRVRPPQYNRMPSSVFYRMMYNKKSLGIQVFPQFLEDLFSTQLKTLRERIELVEDQIRLDCAVLGITDDIAADNFISNGAATSNQASAFAFISTPEGFISDIGDLLKQANPDETSISKNTFNLITTQATSTKDIFTSAQKFAFIAKSLKEATADPTKPNSFNISNITNFDVNLRINELITRIESKSGVKVNKSNFFKVQDSSQVLSFAPQKQIDVFKITKELGDKISERQKAVKLFYSALKSSVEFKSLDDDNDKTANEMLLPGIYGNKNIPEVFEHMIEDESYDDYGPGSGSRYIIKNSQIKSYGISENSPAFTSIEVHGTLNKFAPKSLPEGLNSFPEGGNGLISAIAVDYDLWRNYGFKNTATVEVPFLSDPQSQCAPYAASLLSIARKNILAGPITIAGNEYMQPGEVVFLENMGLLFYVTSVKHSYTEGNNFTTSLDLKYGHSPGEYIPTTLDVIGKILYNNKDIAGYQVHRQTSAFNESDFGAMVLDPNDSSTSFDDNPSIGGAHYGPSNATILNNILYNTSLLVSTNNAKGNNIKTTVELRIYYDKKIGAVNDKLKSFADYIRKLIIGQATFDDALSKNGSKGNITFPESSVPEPVLVDMSSEDDARSPSQKAWDASRNLMQQTSTSSGSKERDKLRQSLFGYIVDCWVKLELLPPEKSK